MHRKPLPGTEVDSCDAVRRGCAVGRLRAVGLFLLLPLCVTPCRATLQVSPFSASLDTEKGRSHVITVINVGERPVPVKLSALSWNLSATGQDERRATDDLILYPGQFIVGPGERRVIRVAPRSTTPPTTEKSYRILIREVPVELGAERPVATGVSLLTSYATAFYLTPQNPQSALFLRSVEREGGGLIFTLLNRGNAHTHLRKLNLVFSQDGRVVRIHEQEQLPDFVNENVLAGNERRFSWHWPAEVPGEIDLSRPFEIRLELECEYCRGGQAVLGESVP